MLVTPQVSSRPLGGTGNNLMRRFVFNFLMLYAITFVACNLSSQNDRLRRPVFVALDSSRIAAARTLLASAVTLPDTLTSENQKPYLNPFSPSTIFLFYQPDSGKITIRVAVCDSCEKVELFSNPLAQGKYAIDLHGLLPSPSRLVLAYIYVTFGDTITVSRRCIL